MADIDVTQYTIGDNTYHYRDGSMVSELANKVNYTDIEDTLDNTSTMPIQNKAVADAIQDLDDTKLDIADIDDHLDTTSENPVQNQVIAEKLNDIGDYARPISSEELEGHAGIVRVGSTLTMNEVEGTQGFLDVKNPTLITPVTFPEGTETVKIADFIDNYGTVGELRAPQGGGGSGTNVIIDPKTILGNKLLIADYWIDGVKGELWAPAGGNGEALKEEIYTNEGTTATDITLDDDYDKYDLLYFTVIKQAGGETTKVITSIETSKIILGDFIQVMGGSAGADWLVYEVNSKTSFELDNTPSGVYIESIVGIGLGAGDKVSVTQKTSTGTNIATVTINNVDTELYAPTITIDSAIDATSENPVQNKVIKTALDGKVDTNGTDRLMTDAEGVKLAGIAAGAEVNVQADWNESDSTSDAYIANKPTIPSALDDLSDVSTTGVSSGQVLTYNGTSWEGATPSAGTVTDVQVDNVSVVSGGVANISTMTGAGASVAGTKGLVPAPASGDNEKFLRGDGTWATAGGGSSDLDAIELTQAEYDALTPAQKSDLDKIYFIKDIEDNARFVRSPLFYSTSEAEVGVWTDGKPLYARTLIRDQYYRGLNVITFDEITSDMEVKYGEGFHRIYDGSTVYTYAVNSNPNYTEYPADGNTSNYKFNLASSSVRHKIDLTIYYTKITDIPGSGKYAELGAPAIHYDGNEKVIGTWFGETLYEKTLDLGSSTTFSPNVWTTISGITMPGCVCKKAEAIDYDGTYSNTFPIAFSINKQTGQLDLNQFRSTTIAVRWITIQYTKATTS